MAHDLTKEQIEGWLDNIIKSKKTLEDLRDLNGKIRLCSPESHRGIHLLSGIDIIAEVLGAKLKEEYDQKRDYPYYYHFEYKGSEVAQIMRERIV